MHKMVTRSHQNIITTKENTMTITILNDKVSNEGSKNYSKNEHNMKAHNNKVTIVNGIRRPNPNYRRNVCQYCGGKFGFFTDCACKRNDDGS